MLHKIKALIETFQRDNILLAEMLIEGQIDKNSLEYKTFKKMLNIANEYINSGKISPIAFLKAFGRGHTEYNIIRDVVVVGGRCRLDKFIKLWEQYSTLTNRKYLYYYCRHNSIKLRKLIEMNIDGVMDFYPMYVKSYMEGYKSWKYLEIVCKYVNHLIRGLGWDINSIPFLSKNIDLKNTNKPIYRYAQNGKYSASDYPNLMRIDTGFRLDIDAFEKWAIENPKLFLI